MRLIKLGRKHSKETREKMSASSWCKGLTKETDERLIRSEESKEKCSIQNKKEGVFINKIRTEYDSLYPPSAVCDVIGIKDGVIHFIEVKNQETHDTLTERQKDFKKLVESLNSPNIIYEVLFFSIQNEEKEGVLNV